MAIKYHKKFKDKKNRINFKLNEKKKRYFKYMMLKYKKLVLIKTESEKAKSLIKIIKHKIQSMPKIKINNYCILTGRDKGVYRDFKLSRHQIKSNFKFLTGLKNSSF